MYLRIPTNVRKSTNIFKTSIHASNRTGSECFFFCGSYYLRSTRLMPSLYTNTVEIINFVVLERVFEQGHNLFTQKLVR